MTTVRINGESVSLYQNLHSNNAAFLPGEIEEVFGITFHQVRNLCMNGEKSPFTQIRVRSKPGGDSEDWVEYYVHPDVAAFLQEHFEKPGSLASEKSAALAAA